MILIVDDDSAVRSSLSFMLKRAGYEVKTAPGPREAMDIVRAESPALILMDMNFTLSTTGEEGLTLLKQVKVFRPDVPVILMTAWGSIQLAVQGMQAGAFDFITKPWNNAALLQRIETALELSAAPKEVPEEQAEGLNRSHRNSYKDDRLRISCCRYKRLLLPVSHYHCGYVASPPFQVRRKHLPDNGPYVSVPAASGASSRVLYDTDYWHALFPRS